MIEETYEEEILNLKEMHTQQMADIKRDRETEIRQLTTDYKTQINELKCKSQQERLIAEQRLKAYMSKLKDLN